MTRSFILFAVLLLFCCKQLSKLEQAEARLAKAQAAITSLHTLKKPLQPGDWLETHKEPGQTFAQFRSQNASRNYSRPVLYIQPLGDFTKEEEQVVKDTAEVMQIFFGVKAQFLEPLPSSLVPKEARRINKYTEHPQLLTDYILEELLAPKLPSDALAVIAFTATDLWPGEGWNFVFGQALFDKPVGVWSLARMGDPKTEHLKCLQRTLKIALHETGHMLGIKHCTAYECGMNGTNSLEETDRHPAAFCPVCERKLWWALEVDIMTRYQQLSGFAMRKGLSEEAAFWGASFQRFTQD
jgi:archaemetzincin